MAGKIIEIKHPLVEHHLSRLRDKNTSSELFRLLADRLTTLLTYEASQDLILEKTMVNTPMAEASCNTLKDKIGLVPILRAGLAMVTPVLDLIPEAEVWHLGFYRDDKTKEPVEYYKKLPLKKPVDVAMVLDPMLATGGSAIAALDAVADWGVPKIKLLVLIAAPEGIKAIQQAYPMVDIYVAKIDEHLDENAYIIPGLGDAGDRIFNANAH